MAKLPDEPDFSEYLESNNSNFRFIGQLLNTFHNETLDRWSSMPDKKVFQQEEFHLAPRIQPLYKQTYLATLVGFDRASIILQGVLLEQLLKELYYAENGEEIEENISNPGLKHALDEMEEEVDEDSYRFINEFRKNIRNNWFHDNNKRIAGDAKLRGKRISLSGEPEDWLEQIAQATQEPLDEEYSYEEQRIVGDIIMSKFDEEKALELFRSTDAITRELSEKITDKYRSEN